MPEPGETVIDLRARYVPASRQIWRLFPGRGYSFLEDYRASSLVFLDVPGLILPEDYKLPPALIFGVVSELDKRIEAFAAIKEWAYKRARSIRSGFMPDDTPRPSDDPAEYHGIIGRKLQTQKAAILSFYGRAEAGDLCVIPNAFGAREILIGEFLERPSVRTSYRSYLYGSENIPARRVRWFPPVDEGDLPQDLTKTLRTSNPFTLLGRQFYDRIFRNTYKTYYKDEEFVSTLDVNGDDFTAPDDINLNILILLAVT